MRKAITGYHTDAAGDLVAELDCGHGQHMRHRPPMVSRPWTATPEGRASMLGTEVDCVRCDRGEKGYAIRRAALDDARAIAEVHVDSWRAAYRGLMPDAVLDGLSVDQRAERWRANLAAAVLPGAETWLLETAAGVRGFASVGPSRDPDAPAEEQEIYALYLAHRAWGRGHGRALVEHAFARVREGGGRDVILWVLDGNRRARRFYEAAGMRADGGAKVESVGGAALPHVRYRATLAP